jgi:indolepyruvate ferredoxin oxidoreductase beta subunit
MKLDLILAGVGGQGILSIAAIVARAALQRGLRLKQSEVHGMAQRGGAVQAHLRLSDQPIHSDMIPLGAADLILAVEPLEALRYLPWLKADGWLIANSRTFENIANYPPIDELLAAIRALPHQVLFDADALAVDHGTRQAMNIALLGAAAPFLALPEESLAEAIRAQFGRKGEAVVAGNLKVFAAGRELSRRLTSR